MIPIKNNITQPYAKWLCDIILYDLLDFDVYKQLTNVSLHAAKYNIVEYYANVCSIYIDVQSFKNSIDQLWLDYLIYGESYVWKQYGYIRKYVTDVMIYKHHLSGEYLEQAVDSKVDVLTSCIRIDAWGLEKDENQQTLMGLVKNAYNFHDVNSSAPELYNSDIRANEEGQEFSCNNLELQDNSRYDEMFFDSVFYTQSMKIMYDASAILYKDSSNGKSNLDILYYSIPNYFSLLEAEALQSKLAEKYKDVVVDARAYTPVKMEYAKYGGLKWGHLPYIDKAYAKAQPGNEAIINNIYKDSELVLASIMKVLESPKIKRKTSGLYFGLIYNEVFNFFNTDECDLSITLRARLNPSSFATILRGVLTTLKVKDMLERKGINFATFPCVELRQNTWRRFSNYFELLNYNSVHEQLDKALSIAYNYNLGMPAVSLEALQPPKESKISELQILEEAKSVSLGLNIQLYDMNNKKMKADTFNYRELALYQKTVANLHSIFSRFTKDKLIVKPSENIQTIKLLELSSQLMHIQVALLKKKPLTLKALSEPESWCIQQISLDTIKTQINYLNQLTDITCLDCKAILQNCLSTLDNPDRLLAYLHDIQSQITNMLSETLSYLDCPFNLKDLGYYEYINLNALIEYELRKVLFSDTRTALICFLDLAGLDIRSNPIKSMTPLIKAIVSLTDYKESSKVIKDLMITTSNFNKFYSRSLLPLLEKKFNVPSSCLRYYGCNNVEDFYSSQDLLQSLFTEVNDFFKVSAQMYNLDYDVDSERFARAQLQIVSDAFNRSMIETHTIIDPIKIEALQIKAINSALNIIGSNGQPLLRPIEKSKKYYIYSTYGLKTVYPSGTSYMVEPMNDDDFSYVMFH